MVRWKHLWRHLPVQYLSLIVGVTVLALASSTFWVTDAVKQHTVEHTTGMLEDLFLIFGRKLQDEALLNDPDALQRAVETFTVGHPRLDTFLVADPQGQIVARGTNLPEPDRMNLQGPAVQEALATGRTVSRLEQERRDDRYPRLTVVVPLQAEGGTWILMGKFSMVMDFENLELIASHVRWIQAAAGGTVALLLSLATYILVLRPIRCLTAVAQQVGEGNLGIHAPCRGFSEEFALLSHSFNQMVAGLRAVWERFLPPQVVERIIHDPQGALTLGGECREVTVLFGDVRDFTPVAERLEPEAVVEQLNELFTVITEIIFAYEGTLDKYLGDGVMAVFGAPFAHDDDPHRAVRCALDMQAALARLQARWQTEGRPILRMGIGIHTGPAVAGNIGSPRRMDYTVIGDTVNTASRIMGIAQAGEVIISAATKARVEGAFTLEALPPVHLKGKQHPCSPYRVMTAKAQ